jgi:hypothetical protein
VSPHIAALVWFWVLLVASACGFVILAWSPYPRSRPISRAEDVFKLVLNLVVLALVGKGLFL